MRSRSLLQAQGGAVHFDEASVRCLWMDRKRLERRRERPSGAGPAFLRSGRVDLHAR